MSKSKWGGPRPKQSDDDQRGGPRPGSGPKRKRWNSGGPGAAWVCERETIGGEIHQPEMWRILSVGVDEIEFQCGDDIIVLRRPDDD